MINVTAGTGGPVWIPGVSGSKHHGSWLGYAALGGGLTYFCSKTYKNLRSQTCEESLQKGIETKTNKITNNLVQHIFPGKTIDSPARLAEVLKTATPDQVLQADFEVSKAHQEFNAIQTYHTCIGKGTEAKGVLEELKEGDAHKTFEGYLDTVRKAKKTQILENPALEAEEKARLQTLSKQYERKLLGHKLLSTTDYGSKGMTALAENVCKKAWEFLKDIRK